MADLSPIAGCLRIAQRRGAAIRRDAAGGAWAGTLDDLADLGRAELARLLIVGSVEAEQNTRPSVNVSQASAESRDTSRPTDEAGAHLEV